MPAQTAPALRLTGLSKTYPSVLALDDFSMTVMPGEVRGLIGKNGAGKSTAIKILSGAVTPDSGKVEVAGETVEINGPQSALRLGIATVYQEISLIPALTVAENILLGRWRKSDRLRFLISPAKGRQFARAILDRLRIDIDPGERVDQLNVAQQQLVEIAKAVSYDPKVLVLDEPTSALPAEEIELVHDVVRTLAQMGTATIYVTHRLHEIPRIANNVTVLRDGRHVDTIPVAEATPGRITELMVGRDWKGMGFDRRTVEAAPLLEVRNLSTVSKLRDVSFALHEGEVLGLAGLLSAGRTELLRAIFGLDPISGGEVIVAGHRVPRPHPALMKSLGVALTPENRKKDGLILDFAVTTNATMAPIDRISRFGWLDHRKAGVTGPRDDRQAGDQDAVRRSDRRNAFRRQSAEGRHRQLAQYQAEDHPHGRAQPRHRCRREAADLSARPPTRRGRDRRALRLLRGRGGAGRLRPHSGHPRGHAHRRPQSQRGHPGRACRQDDERVIKGRFPGSCLK